MEKWCLLFILLAALVAAYPDCASVPASELKGLDCIEVSSCQALSSSLTYYLLTQDVSADHGCFTVTGRDSVLNLNGHEVRYTAEEFEQVYNGDFEISDPANSSLPDGWNLSDSPTASRGLGTYYGPSVWSGNYSMQISVPSPELSFSTSGYVLLEPGIDYMASGSFYNRVSSSISVHIDVLDEGGVVIATTNLNNGGDSMSWRGFQFFPRNSIDIDNAVFSVAQPTNATVRINITGADGVEPGTLYVDYVRLIKYKDIGLDLSADNVTVKDGIMNQTDHDCIHCHVIDDAPYLSNITNITAYFGGVESKGVAGQWGCINVTISHNSFYHNNHFRRDPSDIVIVRDWQYAIIDCARNRGNLTIEGNRVLGSPQYGIRVSDYTSGDLSAGKRYVHSNYVSHDSKYTQAFGIAGYATNMEIYDNVINHSSGRGIHISQENITVNDNWISIREQRNQEYTSMIGYGIQLEGGGNATVYNNYVEAYTHPNNGNCAGLRITDSGQIGTSVYDNTFVARNVNPELGSSFYATALSAHSADGAGISLHNNTFKSNDRVIYFYSSGNFLFQNSTLERLPEEVDYDTLYFNNYPREAGSENNHFLGTEIVDNASFDLVYFQPAWAENSDFTVSSYHRINVYDSYGSLVQNADLVLTNVSGNQVYAGSTGQDGYKTVLLEEFKNHFNEITVDYPYTANVTYGGSSEVFSFNLTSVQVNLTLDQGSHPADLDGDGTIDSSEIRAYVLGWRSGEVSLASLLDALGTWKG